MQHGSDMALLSATIVLAAVTAALTIGPIRRDMNDTLLPKVAMAGKRQR
jgi:hypothetical protein